MKVYEPLLDYYSTNGWWRFSSWQLHLVRNLLSGVVRKRTIVIDFHVHRNNWEISTFSPTSVVDNVHVHKKRHKPQYSGWNYKGQLLQYYRLLIHVADNEPTHVVNRGKKVLESLSWSQHVSLALPWVFYDLAEWEILEAVHATFQGLPPDFLISNKTIISILEHYITSNATIKLKPFLHTSSKWTRPW